MGYYRSRRIINKITSIYSNDSRKDAAYWSWNEQQTLDHKGILSIYALVFKIQLNFIVISKFIRNDLFEWAKKERDKT